MRFRIIPGCSRAWHCLLPLVGLAFTVGCRSGHSPDRLTVGGGRAASDGFAISSPSLVIRGGAPGIAFGTYGVPDTADALSYFVIFKHPRGSLAQPILAPRSSAQSEANRLSAEIDLGLQGLRLSIAHHITLNESRTSIANETLSIQGRAVDVSAGRFFYVDLTTQPLRIEQKSIPLPPPTANLGRPEEVERFAEETIRAVETRAPEVARLVQR